MSKGRANPRNCDRCGKVYQPQFRGDRFCGCPLQIHDEIVLSGADVTVTSMDESRKRQLATIEMAKRALYSAAHTPPPMTADDLTQYITKMQLSADSLRSSMGFSAAKVSFSSHDFPPEAIAQAIKLSCVKVVDQVRRGGEDVVFTLEANYDDMVEIADSLHRQATAEENMPPEPEFDVWQLADRLDSLETSMRLLLDHMGVE